MKVNAARNIDLIVGHVLCTVLRAFTWFFPRAAGKEGWSGDAPRKILAIKCFGFGSILQMAPTLTALKERYPDAQLTLLTFADNAAVAGLLPVIDAVETVEFRKGILVFLLQTGQRILDLRRRRFDVILDCEFFSYYVALFTFFMRTPRTISIAFFNNRPARDWIFSHMISIDVSQHISRVFFKMLAPLGVDSGYRPLEECPLAISTAAKDRARTVLGQFGIQPGDPYVAVNINTSDLCPNRRWPATNFAQLIRRLLETFPALHVVLIGAGIDREYVGALAQTLGHPRVHDSSGQMNLAELAALLTTSLLFIGNDSGPLHLATACGARTLSFFGPETPRLYGPNGPKHRVLSVEAHCSPCLNLFYSKNTRCKNNTCLQAISPEAAFRAATELLPPPEPRP